jgi:hypothetical protein
VLPKNKFGSDSLNVKYALSNSLYMFAPKYGVDPLFNEGMSYTPKRGVNAGIRGVGKFRKIPISPNNSPNV